MTRHEIKNIVRQLPADSPFFRRGSREPQSHFPTVSPTEAGVSAVHDPAFGANLVRSYAAAQLPLPDLVEQPALRRAHRFLLGPSLCDLNVALAFAINLPESKPQRDLLRALLCCKGATIESVAALCRVDPDMVQVFEAAFWNCLDRKGERLYLARICGRLGHRNTPGNPGALGDLGLELLRIAYQVGRDDLVLAAAGIAPAMPGVPAPELCQQIRKGILVSAAKGLMSHAMSEDENPALKPALKIIAAAQQEQPSKPADPGISCGEAAQLVFQSVVGSLPPLPPPELSFEI